jgi:hypothetical protein
VSDRIPVISDSRLTGPYPAPVHSSSYGGRVNSCMIIRAVVRYTVYTASFAVGEAVIPLYYRGITVLRYNSYLRSKASISRCKIVTVCDLFKNSLAHDAASSYLILPQEGSKLCSLMQGSIGSSTCRAWAGSTRRAFSYMLSPSMVQIRELAAYLQCFLICVLINWLTCDQHNSETKVAISEHLQGLRDAGTKRTACLLAHRSLDLRMQRNLMQAAELQLWQPSLMAQQ